LDLYIVSTLHEKGGIGPTGAHQEQALCHDGDMKKKKKKIKEKRRTARCSHQISHPLSPQSFSFKKHPRILGTKQLYITEERRRRYSLTKR
jgi:hypothetical protein